MGLAALVSDLPGRGELVRLEECGLAVPPGVEGHLRGVRRLLADRAARARHGRARPPRRRAALLAGRRSQGDLVDFYGSLCAGLPSAARRSDDEEYLT